MLGAKKGGEQPRLRSPGQASYLMIWCNWILPPVKKPRTA